MKITYATIENVERIPCSSSVNNLGRCMSLGVVTAYYMAESTSGQDEANTVFWLATWAGKVGLSCPLGISRIGPARRKFSFWPLNKSFIDQSCSIKVAAALIFVPKAALNTGGAYSSKYGTLYHICISVLAHRATRNSMNITKNTFLPCLRWNKVKLTWRGFVRLRDCPWNAGILSYSGAH